jgi:uncharacterized FAD-dependent dehydrogenase
LIYDVVIIGAGPAGLFAAYELITTKKLKVAIIDQGKDIKQRKCPLSFRSIRCEKCDPCNILCGLGGAGGLSDGKLNLKSDIGGNLQEFLSEEEANKLIIRIEKIFLEHGVTGKLYGENAEGLEKKAKQQGISFISIPQRHIGSDRLPEIITSIKHTLEAHGCVFFLNTKVERIIYGKPYKLVLFDYKTIDADVVLAAPGRSGGEWLSSEAKRLGIPTRYAPLDVGVRVEVSSEIMQHIIAQAWDPKFHIITNTYQDSLRTFCTCPNGYVVMEDYKEYICVNGHSMANQKSENTNFAFITNIHLTEPVENTTSYGISIAKLATTIGGGMPIIQRLGDLRRGRRSTKIRIERSSIHPTLTCATPGDISMALPHRTVTNIIEGLDQLNKVIPGVASDETLLYAPEVKFYAMRFIVNQSLETNLRNLYVAGDGAGLSRGIVASAATGMIAARSILQKK